MEKMELNRELKLKTSDGEIITTEVEIVKCSETIKGMMIVLDDDKGYEPITLENVSSTTLRKILVWADYHKNDPELPKEDGSKEKRTDDISAWDANFLKVDLRTLNDIISAANFLNIKGLFDVSCKTVANMIKGRTSEEIFKKFNIENISTVIENE